MADKKDKVKAFDAMLQQHIDKKDFVKIYRTFNDRSANISGFILNMSKGFLLMQVANDIMLNGYAIIRKDQFDRLRCNIFERTQKKIYKQEGILDLDFGIDKDILLTGWQDIFKDLRKFDYHVIAECEDLEKPTFTIGIIKRVTKDNVGIQYYDAAGQLEDSLTTVKYSDITVVYFGDRYSKIFRKYLKPAK